jgi:uncharacterized protein
MEFTAFRGRHPFFQLILSLFIILICFLACTLVAMLIAIPLFGIDSLTTLPSVLDVTNPETIRILKYFQVMQTLGMFVVPPFVIAWLLRGKISDFLLLNRGIPGVLILLVVFLVLFVNPFINFLGSLNAGMVFPEWLSGLEKWMRSAEDQAARLTEIFLKVDSFSGLLFNLFMIAVLPALGEELLFRGVLQRIITRWLRNAHWGIAITAVLFSAFHLQFYGFLPRFLLGLIFGYLLLWSGSVWLPVIAHFVNNAAAVVTMWMVNEQRISPAIEEIGTTPEGAYITVISLALTGILLWMIYKQGKETMQGKNHSPSTG